MSPDIHAHDVLDFIAAASRPFARDTLVREIRDRFGASARFHTCSASGMDAEGLVEFLVQRGKLHGEASALTLNAARMCQH